MGDGRARARRACAPQRGALLARRAARGSGRRRGRLLTDDVADLDATAQAELVRRGDVTPLELVDAAIERIERLNPAINAVVHRRDDKARAEAVAAAGPFAGVPMVFKDLGCHTAGDPHHAGMRLLRDLGWTEATDSPLATRFRAGGFVCVGRTNTPELELMPTTEPEAYGPTRNPWSLAHSPGGSSGGSAAAVAAGMVAIAHAGDTGGSIRIPASACGLVGLKPSRGRLGRYQTDDVRGLKVEHVLARSVRDTASVLDVLCDGTSFAGDVGRDPGRLRVGLMTSGPGGSGPVHRDCAEAAEDAGRLLESLGHGVEPSYPSALDDVAHILHFGAVVAVDTVEKLDGWSARTGRAIGADDVEPHTWALAEMGRAIAAGLGETLAWLAEYAGRVTAWWKEGFDLLVTPTLAEPPPLLGELVSTRDAPLAAGMRAGAIVPFAPPFNSTGQPAVSLPISWNDDGLPIGVQLVAAPGREDVLIRVAAQLEQARPWADRWAPVRI